MTWQAHLEYRAAGYTELGMFFVAGTLTGVLADQERSQPKKVEETAAKLSEPYGQLRDSIEQLRRADRLSALGELSAGLAHEIRNPLSLEGSVQICAGLTCRNKLAGEFAEMTERSCTP